MSDAHNRAYRTILQHAMKDGVVTHSERRMLGQVRMDLGITQLNHQHAAESIEIPPAQMNVARGAAGEQQAQHWIPLLSAVALIVGLAGTLVWRMKRSEAGYTAY